MARPAPSDEEDSDDMAVTMTHKGKENAAPSIKSSGAQSQSSRKKLAQLDRTAEDSLLQQEVEEQEQEEEEEEAPRKPTHSNPRPTPSSTSAKPSTTSSSKPKHSSASSSKKAPPPPPPVQEEEDSLMDGQEEEEEEEVVVPKKGGSGKKAAAGGKSKVGGAGNGNGNGEIGTDVKTLLGRIKKLERSVYEVTAERDAFEKERDTYIRQFDELSKIRNTQAEENFKSYREKAEARADKLNDLNKTLTTAYEKEKKERLRLVALGPQPAVVPEPAKGTKDLERMVKEQGKKGKEQADLIEQLQRELKAEVANSRQLLKASSSTTSASATAVAAAASTTAEEITKDQKIAVFYEDLTNLAVVGVKFIQTEQGGPVGEPEFNCIYTYDVDGRSLNFKIRQSSMLNPDLQAAGNPNPYDSVLVYTPLGLEAETPEFVESLAFLKEGFSTKWDKANILWKEIVSRVGAEPEEEEEEEEDEEEGK